MRFKIPRIPVGMSRVCRGIGFKAKQHSPEILVASGIVLGVTAAVAACKATPKAQKVMEEMHNQIDLIHKAKEAVDQEAKTPEVAEKVYSKKDIQKDTFIAYRDAAFGLAKAYGPAVGLGVASIACTLGGHNIMRHRNAALTATVSTLDTAFKNYRKKVSEVLGEEKEKDIFLNRSDMEVTDMLEDGTVQTRKEKVYGDKLANPYARFFDETCPLWRKNAAYNHNTVCGIIHALNDRYKAYGYLYVNDVYSAFNWELTEEGSVMGWVRDKDNPDCSMVIDFGIHGESADERTRAFVNGYERNVLLNIVPDGNVQELFRIKEQNWKKKYALSNTLLKRKEAAYA